VFDFPNNQKIGAVLPKEELKQTKLVTFTFIRLMYGDLSLYWCRTRHSPLFFFSEKFKRYAYIHFRLTSAFTVKNI